MRLRPPVHRLVTSASFVITVLFAILFAWAIWQGTRWPFRAALFPVITATIMLALSLLKLVLDVLTAVREKPIIATVSDGALVEEDAEAEAEAEDIFATAPRAVWINTLAWFLGFFVATWLFGFLVSVPLFTAAYLLLVSRDHPAIVVGYAAVSWLFFWGVFDRLLNIPLPQSVFLGLIPGS